jgi:phosphoribosylanthranilate isomerase
MPSNKAVKICGLTRYEDLLLADDLGADYFGFILYEGSPRCLKQAQLKSMLKDLPLERCYFVDVMPETTQIEEYQALGCKRFQIHTKENTDDFTYKSYKQLIASGNLLLAPHIPDLRNFDTGLLEYTNDFIIDTYAADQIGGTGKTGDWSGFRQLASKYPQKQWILAGGLNPSNIGAAIEESGANFYDINSGVEISPGIKDPNALKELFEKLQLY